MLLSDKSAGKVDAHSLGEREGVGVVGVDVGRRRIEERRGLKDGDVAMGDERGKVLNYVCLKSFCAVWCASLSVLGIPCVVSHYVDDDSVIVFVCCLFYFSEGIREGESFLKDDVVGGSTVVVVNDVDESSYFCGSSTFEITVVVDEYVGECCLLLLLLLLM